MQNHPQFKQRKYKAVLIGKGTMGMRHRSRFESCGVEFVLCLDQEASEWVNSHEAHEFVDTQRPDFVVIASPATTHHVYAKFFLECGVPVFVEKPLACSAQQACELVALAQKKAIILFVAQSECFNPIFLNFRKHFMTELRGYSALRKRSESVSNNERLSAVRLKFCREHGFTSRCRDVDVSLDILVHDLSLFLTMFNYKDVEVARYKKNCDRAEMSLKVVRGPYAGVMADFIADRNSLRDVRTISVDIPHLHSSTATSYTVSLVHYTAAGDVAHIPDSLDNEHKFFLKLLAGICQDWGRRIALIASQVVQLATLP